jgi:serine/threonine protein phosphatase PrpC
MVRLRWGTATDVGGIRTRNEDHALADEPIFVVADGMGGRPGGELASRIAVDAFTCLQGRPGPTQEDVLAAVTRADRAVVQAADGGNTGMGTTLVGLALVTDDGSDYWFGFNIGDSRLYRWAGDVLEQLSTDHSEVQELITAGLVTAEHRHDHPARHVVTRVLGVPAAPPTTDCWLLCPVPRERFLLCSDGLTDELDDNAIATVLRAEPDPYAAARRLVDEALAAGGRDNVTVVVVQVEGDGEPDIDAAGVTGTADASAVTAQRRRVAHR